jgi:ketosteroid isomerase-like protein
MKLLHVLIILSLIVSGCNMTTQEQKMKVWKQEILDTEQAFAKMVGEAGLHKAFVTFAADDAVLLRNEELIIGKKAIDLFYINQNAKGLAWIPDFIEVAKSGELAYTYGHYIYTYTDEAGKEQQSTGIFHSIWKRQTDNSWKFVWD